MCGVSLLERVCEASVQYVVILMAVFHYMDLPECTWLARCAFTSFLSLILKNTPVRTCVFKFLKYVCK